MPSKMSFSHIGRYLFEFYGILVSWKYEQCTENAMQLSGCIKILIVHINVLG